MQFNDKSRKNFFLLDLDVEEFCCGFSWED